MKCCINATSILHGLKCPGFWPHGALFQLVKNSVHTTIMDDANSNFPLVNGLKVIKTFREFL